MFLVLEIRRTYDFDVYIFYLFFSNNVKRDQNPTNEKPYRVQREKKVCVED